MIEVKNVSKSFKIARRDAGFHEAVKALFNKKYETIHALNNISFTIHDGEMVGYIGPNGAGKSSTIKIMSGILTPDSGECVINGRIPWKNRIAHVKEIGVVFGQRSQLWWDLPVIDSYALLKDVYEIKEKDYQDNLRNITNILNLHDIITIPTRQLSLGQRMRCEIGASLLHNPKILFLDEPTIGLDAVSKIAVREFIKKINHELKTTIILTTHDMQDIEALTKRIILIGKGQILLDGTLEQLKQKYSSEKIMTISYEGILPKDENLKLIEDQHQNAKFYIDTNVISTSQAISILSNHVNIMDITVENPSIDDIVVKLYKEYNI